MKLKTLVGSMVVLGLISTGTFAAPAAKAMKGSAASDQAFWTSVMDRNQDNAYLVTGLPPGQVKVTGEVATDLKHTSKGGNGDGGHTGYSADKSKTAFSLHTAELYLDSRVNDFTTVHVALDHDYDNTANHLDGNTLSSKTTLPTSSTMFFPEAYAAFSYQNFFAKVGRQYVNFGSTSHDSITVPLTQDLSQTNETGVTFGVQNLHGFYADAAVYNGADYGDSTSKQDDNRNKVNAYSFELGYAMHTNDYSFNTYVDYISNMMDVDTLNYEFAAVKSASVIPPNKVKKATTDATPGVALHGDFTTGPFTVMADYVTMTKNPNTADYQFGGSGAKMQAYSVEGDYHFMPKQTVTLGFQGSKNTFSIESAGADHTATNTFTMPKTRLLAGYTYQLAKNVSLEGEYTHDNDYGTDDNASFDGGRNTVSGSGKSNNTIVARVKVKF